MIKVGFLESGIAASGYRNRHMMAGKECCFCKLFHVTELDDIAAVTFKKASLQGKDFFASGEKLTDLNGCTV